MDRPRTKQVCTIGPASADKISELVAAGMDVARINFSHGSQDDHRSYVHAVRAAAHSARRSVAVMVDLPGPKIRLGELDGGVVSLETGATFTLRAATTALPDVGEMAGSVEPLDDADSVPETVDEATAVEEAAGDTYAASETVVETTAQIAPISDAPAATQVEQDTAASASAAQEVDDTTGASMAVGGTTRTPVAMGDRSGAEVSIAGLAAQLQVGDRVLLADGAAELRVSAISGSEVQTEVVHGGLVRSRSGVNIPSGRLAGEGLTDTDRTAIPRALELRVDLIAQSFVRSADDVRALRALLPVDGPRVVAKIETRAAIDNFDAIAREADGIVVARGDLGVDVPFEDVPMLQKDLIRRATEAGRFTVVATQMLESMTGAPRPTRAEASDVANAVLDGADAVMLSAETAIGSFPVEALEAMERICVVAEPGHGAATSGGDPAASITAAAAALAESSGAGAVWCFTRTGRTAEMLSLHRPSLPIVAFTLSPIVARRLAVRGGVIPLVLPGGGKSGPLIEQMELAWRSQRPSGDYDTVMLVTTSTQPAGINRLELHRLSGASAKR